MKNLIVVLLLLLGGCSKSQSVFTYSLQYYNFVPQQGFNTLNLCIDKSTNNNNFDEKCNILLPTIQTYNYNWTTNSNQYTIHTDCLQCDQFSTILYINNLKIADKTFILNNNQNSLVFSSYPNPN